MYICVNNNNNNDNRHPDGDREARFQRRDHQVQRVEDLLSCV